MSARRFVLAAGLALCAAPLAAQVGYPPQQSPYRDLRETMELTFYSGYFRAKKDPARVAPVSGPIVGAMYQWRAGGPAHLTLDLARVESERRVLDPEKGGIIAPATTGCVLTDPNCKSAGMYRWPLYMLDGGLTMALTGERSFMKMVPLLKAGDGIV